MLEVGPAGGQELTRILQLARDSLDIDPASFDLHPDDACLVAKDALTQDVLGFALARREAPCEAHLLALAVDQLHRGEGIGAHLLRYAQDVMYRSGARHIHLEVRSDDVRARAFYGRWGYQPAGVADMAFPDGESALVLERPL